jgi:hypothetical protein
MSRQLGLAAAALAVLIWGCLFAYNTPSACVTWDDAYMFVRYATRLLNGFGLSWNPGQGPTWGPTSLAFLLVVTPMRLLFQRPDQVALAASMVSGVLFVALQLVLVKQVAPACTAGRLFVLALLLGTLALGGDSLTSHFYSGMDTTFAMAYLSLFLVATHRLRGPPTRGAVALAGVIAGFAPWARPEFAVYVALVPLALVTSSNPNTRRAGLQVLAISATVMLLCWGGCWAYFGTPLPLAFYVKSTPFYDQHFLRLYASAPRLQLEHFVATFSPVLVVGVLALLLRWRSAVAARVDLALIVALAIVIAYYRYHVLQVMFYFQRFYYPTLPVLLYLLLVGVSRWLDDPPQAAVQLRTRLGGARTMNALGGLALIVACVLELRPNAPDLPRTLLCSGVWKSQLGLHWRALVPLPDDIAIATTEVGMPGVWNPNKTIVDLSGLNDRAIATRHSTPLQAVELARVDVVYLHTDYVGMNSSFTQDASFASGYEHLPAADQPPLQVYLRRDSPHHAALQAVLQAAEVSPPAAGQ